jgi:uncharacterized protein (TIGR02996 family)
MAGKWIGARSTREGNVTEEQAFLRAIRANPDEAANLLVYADWLEERGDPRAEYIRLEYQPEQITARIEALQRDLDPEWAAQVCRLRRVVLLGYRPEHKITVIRLIRQVTGLGLKEAKDLSESLPAVVMDRLIPEAAERVRDRFGDYARVVVEPAFPPPK